MTFGSLAIVGRHDAGVTSVRISPFDRRIFTLSLDRTVRVWNGSAEPLIRFPQVRLYRGSKPVPTLATTLAVAAEFLVCGMHNGVVELYSPDDGRLIRKLPNPQERSAYAYNFHTVTVYPSDAGIVAGSNGGYLVVWSAADGKILWRETSFRLVNSARFLRSGQFLMAHEWDPWIHIWDFKTKQRFRWETSIMDTSANWVTACTAPAASGFDFVISTEDADESRLIAASLDHPDPLWDVATGARVHEVCFLPEGRYLLAGGDAGVIELWDTQSDSKPQQLDLRSEPLLTAEFSAAPGRRGGLILTAPTLDEESYPPWTIHTLDVASDGSFAALGLANGLVLRVEINL